MWNCCIWDPLSGSSFVNFKGGNSSARSLCILGGQFLLSGVPNKPLINAWAVQRKEQQQLRMVCPGAVSTMAVSPDSTFCVAGIAEKVHVWQTATGHLLSVLSRHFQRVTNICFTDDGSHFVTGGEDNLIMVWDVMSILQPMLTQNCEPLHVFAQHSLPITDLHCGKGGICARLASSSQDQTCKLWDLSSGQLLCSFIFDSPILSVRMDLAEYRLFAGGLDANIYSVNLYEQTASQGVNRSCGENEDCLYKGHSKPVTCLSVSVDGSLLLSGSEDNTVRIWHIGSKQCIKILNHKSPITNAMFMMIPYGMQNPDFKSTLPLQPFQRHLFTQNASRNVSVAEEKNSDLGFAPDKGSTIPINLSRSEVRSTEILSKQRLRHVLMLNAQKSSASDQSEELLRVKRINQDLQKFLTEAILQSDDSVK